MEQFVSSAFVLVKSALDGQKYMLPPETNYERLYNFGRQMQILPLLYAGIENCAAELPAGLRERFEKFAVQAFLFSTKQWTLLQSVCAAFELGKIDYMPLKGTLLKELYPSPEMRMMSDADILIRVEQYPRIREIMIDLGFTENIESDHELFWKKNGFVIELHKRLIPSYNKDYYAYFGEGWQRAVRVSPDEYRYRMSDEDAYVYLLTHFAKHFRDGGIGPRHFIDFFVYRQKKELDAAYLDEQFDKLKLREFNDHLVTAIDWLFANGAPDSVSEYLLERICHSGPYGDSELRRISAALKDQKRSGSFAAGYRRRLFGRFFPPLAAMQSMYPALKHRPFLLPFFWVARWFSLVFLRHHTKEYYQRVFEKNERQVAAYENELKKIGLDYSFEHGEND